MDDQLRTVARAFVDTFGRADLAGMRAVLSDDFVGHITTADGGTRDLSADQYVAAVDAMDVPTAQLRLEVPDISIVGDATVLVMVEVHASRGSRSLHNFSGQLLRIVDSKVGELWMVDAKPAESDAFWADHRSDGVPSP